MGRRATATTKGGRYMNPADQARKAARKKELKKNKRQRQLVRQAVLKSKDPEEILRQMEHLDSMEFSVTEGAPLNERVIHEKRTKLRETFLRVLGMYKRENETEKFAEMKKMLQEYERKRNELEQHFLAVKFASEVNPAEIPLPDAAPPPPESEAAMTPTVAAVHHGQLTHSISGQPMLYPFKPVVMKPGEAVRGILKKAKAKYSSAPGVPCGAPPELSDTEEEEGEAYSSESDGESVENPNDRSSRIRFEGVGSDDNEKDSRTKYKKLAKKLATEGRASPDEETGAVEEDEEPSGSEEETREHAADYQTLPSTSPAMAMSNLLQMPPIPPDIALRPGPHRILPPPVPSIFAPRLQRPMIGPMTPAAAAAAILSAPPSVANAVRPLSGPVIEARPQLRNMQQEVTRLVPTAVKIKRENYRRSKGPAAFSAPETSSMLHGQSTQTQPQKSTDVAYEQFMKEMQDLL